MRVRRKPEKYRPSPLPLIKDDWRDLRILEAARPPSLRSFDQIPMRGCDLLQQVKQIAPAFAGRSVAFVGDSDGMSVLLGLLAMRGGPRPAVMHVLDFDERLLAALYDLAARHGFDDLLHGWHYNVFDPIPAALHVSCDWFYTNPPYGMRNNGASARLFVARGCELVTATGAGGIVLPDDPARPWSVRAMRATMRFLGHHGWIERKRFPMAHRYELDDDPELASDLVVVDRVRSVDVQPLAYTGRGVDFSEIPNFYGYSTTPPYPRYIGTDGTPDYTWAKQEEVLHEWRRTEDRKAA